MGDAAAQRAQGILADLRRSGVSADMAFRGNVKKRMQKADALGARYVLILGDEEIARDQVMVKSLSSGEQAAMPLRWIPQGIFDLIFEDVGYESSGGTLPPLAERLARA